MMTTKKEQKKSVQKARPAGTEQVNGKEEKARSKKQVSQASKTRVQQRHRQRATHNSQQPEQHNDDDGVATTQLAAGGSLPAVDKSCLAGTITGMDGRRRVVLLLRTYAWLWSVSGLFCSLATASTLPAAPGPPQPQSTSQQHSNDPKYQACSIADAVRQSNFHHGNANGSSTLVASNRSVERRHLLAPQASKPLHSNGAILSVYTGLNRQELLVRYVRTCTRACTVHASAKRLPHALWARPTGGGAS